ncbi:hypothetical protein AA309_20220 [Microvirga vignae]|uniref:Uncharacterized protein n=1 Tax=Microvirga vignae TaxID=1225564 RepID=A0A0H1R8C4_9HYPH|nr:hypothetical protein [Microvirga vignae]KLK91423.1 hypothetical protein AA309_20220 [Microvirga vignae]
MADPLFYYIGKGKLSWTPTGGVKRDLGNVPELEFTPELETLPHYSSRTGSRTKDREVVVAKGGTIRIVMEEFTAANIAMMVMGTVSADTLSGGDAIDVFAVTEITGQIDFESTNDVGPKIDMTLYNVSFKPGASLSLISEEWGGMELSGETLVAPDSHPTAPGKVGKMIVVKPEGAIE